MDGFGGPKDGQRADEQGQQQYENADDGQQTQKVLIQNATPGFLQDCFYLVVGVVEKYGWFIILGLVVSVLLWNKLRPHWAKMMRKWQEQQDIANFDPDKAADIQNRVYSSRQRWQEIQDAKAARYAEEKKKADEEKRKELIEDWERHKQGKGYKSKQHKAPNDTSLAEKVLKPKKKKSDQDRKPLRPSDYSPLSGGNGGSCSWRPQPRGGGG